MFTSFLLLVLLSNPSSTGKESLEDLVLSLEEAFAENDLEKFLSLHYWEGVPGFFREGQVRAFSITQPHGLEVIEIVDVDPQTAEKLARGIVHRDRQAYVPNLEPVKLIMARHGDRSEPQIPVGIHEGRFYLCLFQPAG